MAHDSAASHHPWDPCARARAAAGLHPSVSASNLYGGAATSPTSLYQTAADLGVAPRFAGAGVAGAASARGMLLGVHASGASQLQYTLVRVRLAPLPLLAGSVAWGPSRSVARPLLPRASHGGSPRGGGIDGPRRNRALRVSAPPQAGGAPLPTRPSLDGAAPASGYGFDAPPASSSTLAPDADVARHDSGAVSGGGAGGGGVGDDDAETQTIVSFKKLEIDLGPLDFISDQQFLEAVYMFVQTLPLRDLWQDERWNSDRDVMGHVSEWEGALLGRRPVCRGRACVGQG